MSPNVREYVTLLIRLVTFAATLALLGAFFLPWVRLDGMSQPVSAAEIVAIVVSPTLNYLVAVSTLQAVVLVGCSGLMIVSAIVVLMKYGRRQTAVLATSVVLAS